MGTNYYAIYNKCDKCDRYDEIHIGKNSCGWIFTFHSTGKLTDSTKWKDFLNQPDVEIVDEYSTKLTLKEFWTIVEDSKPGLLKDKVDYSGYSLSDRTFS